MKNNQLVFNGIHNAELSFTENFISLFPKMMQLLSKAYKVEFTVNSNQRFRQYLWTKGDGNTIGWLCKLRGVILFLNIFY